jgi:hypothetical protein
MVPYLLLLAQVIYMSITSIGSRHADPEWLILVILPVVVTLAVVVLERVRRRER